MKNAITCANGTDALVLALMSLDIGEGDAVFVPTFSFFASAEAISLLRATPVFVDSDPVTFNICPEDLEEKIQAVLSEGRLDIKAVMAVNLFGMPADYPMLRRVAKKYGLKIVEDSAQGFGGSIGSEKACSLGDIATTSFFPAKPLGCYGDGGAVFTNDDGVAQLIKSLRVHGQGKSKYDNIRVGLNSRLDTIQAAILLEKLAIFPDELEARARVAAKYDSGLSGILSTPQVPINYISSWAQYTLVAKSKTHRIQLMNHLKEKNIPSEIYYQKCIHDQPVYRMVEGRYGSLERAEKLSERVFSLPMHPYLGDTMIENVIRVLSDIND